ncbi:WXG100 family type VII secretion target [Paenibacillus andongensis]|uniref:WXG100 family type VII secretion target n=1 Tax=Paenibacillus andongensis TaxID=2975482 RepID=UPI0021BB0565|nr:WXG100 family type VII secretion target [Paenibacillus andongensis]
MASIKVNSTVMRDKAESLKGIAKSIQTFTEEMTNEINRLRSSWEGDVAETTVKKFNDLKDDFDNRFNTINEYANFLVKAAEEWDKVNQENLQAAESQRSDT